MDNRPPSAWGIVSQRYMCTFILFGTAMFLCVLLFFQEMYIHHMIGVFDRYLIQNDATAAQEYTEIANEVANWSTFRPVFIFLVSLATVILAMVECGFPSGSG